MNTFETYEIELGPESEKLTGQQKAVILFLALGLSNKKIGALMHRSPETVKTHVDALFSVFGVESRTGIVSQAFCHGVLQPCAKVVAVMVAKLASNTVRLNGLKAYRNAAVVIRKTHKSAQGIAIGPAI